MSVCFSSYLCVQCVYQTNQTTGREDILWREYIVKKIYIVNYWWRRYIAHPLTHLPPSCPGVRFFPKNFFNESHDDVDNNDDDDDDDELWRRRRGCQGGAAADEWSHNGAGGGQNSEPQNDEDSERDRCLGFSWSSSVTEGSTVTKCW